MLAAAVDLCRRAGGEAHHKAGVLWSLASMWAGPGKNREARGHSAGVDED